MLENKTHFQKVLTVFLGSSLPIAFVVAFFSSLQVGLIFGSLFGIFCSVHIARSLQQESFEINLQNKDKLKGLSFYENEIISIMNSLRYELTTNDPTTKIWQPSVRARVMGGDFKMEVTPYTITVSGARGVVRIVVSMLDIQKIFI